MQLIDVEMVVRVLERVHLLHVDLTGPNGDLDVTLIFHLSVVVVSDELEVIEGLLIDVELSDEDQFEEMVARVEGQVEGKRPRGVIELVRLVMRGKIFVVDLLELETEAERKMFVQIVEICSFEKSTSMIVEIAQSEMNLHEFDLFSLQIELTDEMALFVVGTEFFSVEALNEDEPLAGRIGAKVEIIAGVKKFALIAIDLFVSLLTEIGLEIQELCAVGSFFVDGQRDGDLFETGHPIQHPQDDEDRDR